LDGTYIQWRKCAGIGHVFILRITNGEIIQKQTIKDTGATAVFEVKGGIQAVFGGKADLLSQEINQILGKDN
ncbi:hypothetical protein SJ916_16840, partial [Enterococcus faecium]